MAYIGNPPAERYSSVSYQDLTGGTGTSFTLDYAVGSANEIEVFVNNVRQEPSVAYTVAGTALTMTGSIASTDDFYVVFQGKAQQTATHPAGNNLQAVDGTFTGNVSITGTTTSTGAITATAGIILPSGQGIDFSATSDGSGTTTSELLDDYEESTWSPIVSDGTNTVTVTDKGTATKIGRLVCATFDLYNVSTSSFTSTASVRIQGLPFTSQSTHTASSYGFIAGITANTPLVFYVNTSASEILVFSAVSSTQNLSNLTFASLGANVSIRGEIFYLV